MQTCRVLKKKKKVPESQIRWNEYTNAFRMKEYHDTRTLYPPYPVAIGPLSRNKAKVLPVPDFNIESRHVNLSWSELYIVPPFSFIEQHWIWISFFSTAPSKECVKAARLCKGGSPLKRDSWEQLTQKIVISSEQTAEKRILVWRILDGEDVTANRRIYSINIWGAFMTQFVIIKRQKFLDQVPQSFEYF